MPAALIAQANREAQTCPLSTAVCLARFSTVQHLGKSSGDEAWAIIRDRRVVTMMYRYAWQTNTPDQLRVSDVRPLN